MGPQRLTPRGFRLLSIVSTVGGVLLVAFALNAIFFQGHWGVGLLALGVGTIVGLLPFVVQAPPEPPPPVVTLYTRQGCSLCEEAEIVLANIRGSMGFDLWVVDVDRDEEALSKWGKDVPVVTFEGRAILKGPFDPSRAQSALRLALKARKGRRVPR